MEEDFEEVMTIPENSELNLVRRNSDFVENNFVDSSSPLVENKDELANSTSVDHESDNVDNNPDFVDHTSNNLEHNLELNGSDPEFVEHKFDNDEGSSDAVEHNFDESKSECDENQSKHVDNYSDFVDENNVDTPPARSQTMPNISSTFVDVHPNLIDNSKSPKILNSVFEDLESPRPPSQPAVERRFHKNSTTVASAVNAYSKSIHDNL
jgi:hypothetical protein